MNEQKNESTLAKKGGISVMARLTAFRFGIECRSETPFAGRRRGSYRR